MSGTVRYDAQHGCFLLDGDGSSYPVVWPAGAGGVPEGPGVQLPEGLIVTVGDRVSGGGGFHQAGEESLARFDIPAECLPQNR